FPIRTNTVSGGTSAAIASSENAGSTGARAGSPGAAICGSGPKTTAAGNPTRTAPAAGGNQLAPAFRARRKPASAGPTIHGASPNAVNGATQSPSALPASIAIATSAGIARSTRSTTPAKARATTTTLAAIDAPA